MIRTTILLLYLAVGILLFGPFLLLYGVLGGAKRDRYYWIGAKFAVFPVRPLGIRTRVEGLENIPAGGCVFASNHVSNIDPLVIVDATPRRLAILAKKSLFKIPIMGMAWRLGRFVPVDRQDRSSAVNSIREAAGYMKQGLSFLIYPEGTRSKDGHLLPFKRAGFALAIEAKAPVVPVACIGTQRIWPKGSFGIHGGEVTVKFCPPIDASRFTMHGRQELADAVRAAIAAALPEEQRPLAAEGANLSPLRQN